MIMTHRLSIYKNFNNKKSRLSLINYHSIWSINKTENWMITQYERKSLTEFESFILKAVEVLVSNNLGDDLVDKDVLHSVLYHVFTLCSHCWCNSQHINRVLLRKTIQSVIHSCVHSCHIWTTPEIRIKSYTSRSFHHHTFMQLQYIDYGFLFT